MKYYQREDVAAIFRQLLINGVAARGPIPTKLRLHIWRTCGVTVGQNVRASSGVKIIGHPLAIVVGDRCVIGRRTLLVADARIQLEAGVIVGAGSVLTTRSSIEGSSMRIAYPIVIEAGRVVAAGTKIDGSP